MNTRATLRTYLQLLIDPATSYTTAEYNNAINIALQHLSTALPQKQHATGIVTGRHITIARPITAVDYLLINGTPWQPLHTQHPDFAIVGEANAGYYDIRPNEDETLITLNAPQTAVPYTIAYWAPIDLMADDSATGLPDTLKHVLYLGVIAGLLTHRQAEANAAATDSDLMTFLRTAAQAHYGRFYDAIQLAQAIAQQGIQP